VDLTDGRARVTPASGSARGVPLVETDATGLARLLAEGGTSDLLAVGAVRVRGALRRARALRVIPPAELRLDVLAEVGIWLDPALVYRALVALIDPELTAGHRFTVEYEVRGPRGARFHVVVADGEVPAVRDGASPQAVVRVAASHRLFQHLLGAGQAPEGERLDIRGDSAALATLHRWVAAVRDAG
jgi:hypothetical protein